MRLGHEAGYDAATTSVQLTILLAAFEMLAGDAARGFDCAVQAVGSLHQQEEVLTSAAELEQLGQREAESLEASLEAARKTAFPAHFCK